MFLRQSPVGAYVANGSLCIGAQMRHPLVPVPVVIFHQGDPHCFKYPPLPQLAFMDPAKRPRTTSILPQTSASSANFFQVLSLTSHHLHLRPVFASLLQFSRNQSNPWHQAPFGVESRCSDVAKFDLDFAATVSTLAITFRSHVENASE